MIADPVRERRSVLVVDDDSQIRALACSRLRASGLEVEEASDGGEAVRKLEGRAFSAVVCDIIMPNREGIETIIEVRRRWPSTYIVAMSGGGRIGPHDFLHLARLVGADEALAKPFRMSQLVGALEQASMACSP